jgi:hypothetical protein
VLPDEIKSFNSI